MNETGHFRQFKQGSRCFLCFTFMQDALTTMSFSQGREHLHMLCFSYFPYTVVLHLFSNNTKPSAKVQNRTAYTSCFLPSARLSHILRSPFRKVPNHVRREKKREKKFNGEASPLRAYSTNTGHSYFFGSFSAVTQTRELHTSFPVKSKI